MRHLLAAALVLGATPGLLSAEESLRLRYAVPARRWTEALPVGNGRLGAMIFGGGASERLQLNEATLWSGGPKDWNNPGAREVLPQVRAAIFAGDFVKATELAKRMQGPYNQSYQPLGDLRLHFSGEAAGPASAYERALDLDRAVATVRYRVGDATFTREVFASFPDQVIVVRLTCDQPGRIAFSMSAASTAPPGRRAVRAKIPPWKPSARSRPPPRPPLRTCWPDTSRTISGCSGAWPSISARPREPRTSPPTLAWSAS